MQSPEIIIQSPEISSTTIQNSNGVIPDEDEEVTDFEASVSAVEKLLNYRFRNRKLLEEALTHSSCTDSVSYQRLEFVGDAALGLAFANHVYLTYPELDPGQLSLLRAANISTEKLARVAVRHGLYRYVRHNAIGLDEKVKEFVIAVSQEDSTEVHGGRMKAPKVLADIVESVAAAVYVDCNFDLKSLWEIFKHLFEPIITLDLIEEQPQPVTMLFELCHKHGKQVDIKHWRKEDKNITSVYVDGQFVATGSSEHKESAKLNAAKLALKELANKTNDKNNVKVEPYTEIEGAKQKLIELCARKKCPLPTYRIEKSIGPAHGRSFVCSVRVTTTVGVLYVEGEMKPRLKDAENSAASAMIWSLLT